MNIKNLNEIAIDHEKLKAFRGDKSLAEVAEKLGVTKQAISNYENGSSNPSGVMLLRICLLYGIEISSLADKKILVA